MQAKVDVKQKQTPRKSLHPVGTFHVDYAVAEENTTIFCPFPIPSPFHPSVVRVYDSLFLQEFFEL